MIPRSSRPRLPRYPFYRQFILISLLITALVGIVLLFAVERLVTRQVVMLSEHLNIDLATQLAREILPPTTEIPPDLYEPQFLHRFIIRTQSHLLAEGQQGVVLVRLYDAKGRIIVTVPQFPVPNQGATEPLVGPVLAGKVVSKFQTAEEVLEEGHLPPGILPPYIVETLVPIRPSPSEHPIGAFAVYRDVTEEFLQARQTITHLLDFLLLCLVLIFVGQGIVARRTGQILNRRTAALESVLQVMAAAEQEEEIDNMLGVAVDGLLAALNVPIGVVCAMNHLVMRGIPLSARETLQRNAEIFKKQGFLDPIVIENLNQVSLEGPFAHCITTMARQYGVQALVVSPLFTRRGEHVGGLLVASYQRRSWTEEDVYLVTAVAHQLGIILDRLELIRELQATNVRLNEALEARDAMIRNVSHELRTPLTIIWGYLELLYERTLGPLTPEQERASRLVLKNIERLRFMVERLVQMRALEAGDVEKSPLSLNAWLRDIVDEWTNRARRAGVTLEVDVPERPVIVEVDERLFHSVIQNLLDNAIKFSPHGGRIRIQLLREGNNAHIIVTDEGIGIPPDKLERIFERFYQVDASTTRKFGGMGIGLSLCREIVEMHGGRIWAESEGEGKGATFHVVLPVARGEEEEREMVLAPSAVTRG